MKRKVSDMPFFGTRMVGVTLIFRMRRPKSHFVGGRRSEKLKTSAPRAFPKTRADVDNLAKLVLDALNGVLYEDDGQVASFCATKVLDNSGACEGATVVTVFPLSDADLERKSQVIRHV